MKINFICILTILFVFQKADVNGLAVTFNAVDRANPRTILWKISKPGLSKPSYLLGINHIVSADWLYTFPEIKDVIESSELLVTELFGDNDRAIIGNTREMDIKNRSKVNLRAVDLLTPKQYATLDSFFIAKVGEGITNNQEALEMNVAEMSSAILMTLLTDKNNPNEKPCMDRELFKIFKDKQMNTLALDHIENFEFDDTNKERGREILSSFVELSKGGNDPGWNISDTTYTVGKFLHDYKMMNLDYKLTKTDPEKESFLNSHTVRERNDRWMPLIESSISQKSALIAVGAAHLWYNTGVIALLRSKGYTVEPVLLRKFQ
ncbi:MAG: TraB/GumN family protein [Dyadobacter sp.]|uniref:TraB/GumN family protein n=1 Tax=Dyadobacter sp. TaxID=1914288 RepID=UPI0032652F6C